MGKKSRFGSGMIIPDHISESLETIFGFKILKFFDADEDQGSGICLTLDPGSKVKKTFGSGIPHKHPGAGTVPLVRTKKFGSALFFCPADKYRQNSNKN
jgi:hypothetical protein